MENYPSNTHSHRRLNLAMVGIGGQMVDDTAEGGFDDINNPVSKSTKTSSVSILYDWCLTDGFT